MAIQTVSQSLSNEGVSLGYKNKIINGNMAIAQRATTFSITGSPTYGSVDRWMVWQGGGSASGYFNRVSAGLTGFQYAARYGRNAGNGATTTMILAQGLESVNSIPLQGKTVTMSFWARAGANWSPSSGYLSLTLRSGTGTDETPSLGGGLTGAYTVASVAAPLTTTWTRYSCTGVVPSNCTQLVPLFTADPVGTAGANDYFEITGVQLEEGSSPTAFENRHYQQELALCQRYFQKSFSQSVSPVYNSGTSDGGVSFNCLGGGYGTYLPVRFATIMRTAPTVTSLNPSAANYLARNTSLSADITYLAINRQSDSGFSMLAYGTNHDSNTGQQCVVNWKAEAEL